MKNIINNIFSLFFIVAVLSMMGCDDKILDTVPKTTVSENDAYSTPGKILAQVNNLYGQLQSATFYGGRFIVFNEQRADEFGQNDGNAATGSAIWNQNVASTSEYINNVWAAGYAAINASNVLMAKLNGGKVVSDSLAKLYTAEAKFVRALSYFSLVQTYAKPYNLDKTAPGLPLRVQPITSAGSNDLARSSVEAVYNLILSDLDAAEVGLPIGYSSAALNASRAKKSTAIALKTRVYLHQGNFAKVKTESEKIVSSSAPYQYSAGTTNHKLESNFATIFSGSYVGSEAIFSIPFANTTNETPPTQSALAFNYLAQPIIFLAAAGVASHDALNSPDDSRASLIGTNTAKQKVLRKFAITTAPFRDYVPVIRYSEVLLNYAEAAANLGDIQTAQNLLKAVRNRANSKFIFSATDIDTKDALLKTIATERRIEFVGEGLRLGDLQRKSMTIPAKIGSIGTAPLVLPTASNYIWPIPSGELSANKLIVTNP
ncbi:RagB/SusD family nutrient uptake outer membrane protein [Lacihabitans sp. CCS-44]|uniref:RagB/SusD family nutrient uptake outer membrane protein n=1 Tax=Lacihabitans sp. CCS-44 TaxID=2487331 RepID=UPI0020CF4799|nr:RagB/SusD family nutrient uptake outer membrane protein [Lacihabitans sp. CCS-44]MCP9756120.1 RagB/SusD family nutrient uptake outer membrane protein [Lacihabitans sp. CCS-44]